MRKNPALHRKIVAACISILTVCLTFISCGDSNTQKPPTMAGYTLKGSAILTKEIRDESRGVTQYMNVECKLDGCFLKPDSIRWTSTGTVVTCTLQCPESWGSEVLTALMMGVSMEGQLPGGGAATAVSSSKEIDWKKKQIKLHTTFDLPGDAQGKRLVCILAVEYASEIDGNPMKANQPMEVSIDETATVKPVKQYLQSGTFGIEIP